MEVITRKGLKELLSEISQFTPDEIIWIADKLSSKLEEIDTLTVDKLRPMCDARRDGDKSFLVKLKGIKFLREGYFDSLNHIWIGGEYFPLDRCEGWIPMPIYEPRSE